MTHRERVIDQIRHQETDFIPYYLTFEEGFDLENQLDTYYGSSAWRHSVDNAIRYIPQPSTAMVIDPGDEDYWTDLYGTTWRCDVRPWHVVEPALCEPTLAGYEFPGLDRCFDPDWEESARALIEESSGYFILGWLGYGLFERSWAMRGFENVLMDVALHPGFYEELLERITAHQLEILDRILKLPIDGIFFSDDWGYQDGVLIGAERWRKFLKPRIARMYERVRQEDKYVLTHCCGSIVEILPDVIEIGLDVYESVQPEAKGNDLETLKRSFGDDLTFWGGLGSQSILPFGTPQEIKDEVAHLCKHMGKGGGYILAPAKALQPETPVENAAAVVEAFLEQANVHL